MFGKKAETKKEKKPKSCDRCGFAGFVERGGIWGCLECGLWYPYVHQVFTSGWYRDRVVSQFGESKPCQTS